MPRILITSLFLFNFCIVCAQTMDNEILSVILENCSSAQRKVLVSVQNPSTFYHQKPPFWIEKTAKIEVLSFTFKLATNTPYAVMVLHDENENYQMDFNRLGLPKENAANSGK